jgi:hypothetical protein
MTVTLYLHVEMVIAVARLIHRGGFVVLGSRTRKRNGGQGEHLQIKTSRQFAVYMPRDPVKLVAYGPQVSISDAV